MIDKINKIFSEFIISSVSIAVQAPLDQIAIQKLVDSEQEELKVSTEDLLLPNFSFSWYAY